MPIPPSEHRSESGDHPVPERLDGHIVNENSANDSIELHLISGFAQRVDFGVFGTPSLVIDEPEPLGENGGPSPTRVLAAALASCLGASLLFCLRKARIDVLGLHTQASVGLMRNERGRLRIEKIDVQLEPVVPLDQQPRMTRCLEIFEDFCVVTASVRPGITVNVSVNPVAPGESVGDDASEPVSESTMEISDSAPETPA
jgi:uncharacterized OsmC-like protein